MSSRWLATAIVALCLPLTACGGDDDKDDDAAPNPPPTSGTPTVNGSPSATPGTTEATPSPQGPCDLLSAEDVTVAFDTPVLHDGTGGGTSDRDGLVWKSHRCTWEQDDGLEVALAVSRAEDFETGTFACPPLKRLDNIGVEVPGLASPAWWLPSSFGDVEGTLRICTEDAVLDLEAEVPTGDRSMDVLRDQTVALAEVLLTRVAS